MAVVSSSAIRDRRWALSPASARYHRRERIVARLQCVAQTVALGFLVAAVVFAIPFVGLVIGAALGVDMGVLQ